MSYNNERMVSGYCNWCDGNTDHGHCETSGLAGIGHALVRLFSGSRGYGPWYCSGCRRVTKVILPEMENRSGLSEVKASDSAQPAVVSPAVGVAVPADVPQAVDVRRPLVQEAQPQDTKKSLASSRYSQKYRFAVAKRIIEGSATFRQVSDELSISKHEIWGWLVELFQDNQEQIARLKKLVRTPPETAEDVSDIKQPIDAVKSENKQSWSPVVGDSHQTETLS